MVAAAPKQFTRDDAYHDMISELTCVKTLRTMEDFHTKSIIKIKRRIAEIDPQRHPLAGKPPFSERTRRGRAWDEGVAITCLAFSCGLVFLAALAHVGRLLWDALSP